MKCLILVDVQLGFVNGETRSILPLLETLARRVSAGGGLVLSTRFLNDEKTPFQTILNWERMSGPPETDLVAVASVYSARIFEKTGYGCPPALLSFLRERGIEETALAGMDTDGCVLKTALDLFEAEIRPVVLLDCCASTGGEALHQAGLTVLRRSIGAHNVVPSTEWETS